MTVAETTTGTSEQAQALFESWLESFAMTLESGDAHALAAAFTEDGHWRDILAFTWDFRTFSGQQDITVGLKETLDQVRPRGARPAADRQRPKVVKRSGRRVVEAYFDFDTELGRATGFVRLPVPTPGEATKVWILLTTLQELRGFEERSGARRPTGTEWSRQFGGDNWLDTRNKSREFADRDPEVVIIGGGQAGLALGARLVQLGVDALIIERNPRIGDNWRNRYHSLTLHNEVWANSLPYIPFPSTWPTFLPKDKLAGWLESYAEFMELNVWTGTEFLGGSYDEQSGAWTLTVRRADGDERQLATRHTVLATGSVSGVPRMPSLPGLENFTGEVVHSSGFSSGTEYEGKRAIIFGTGNSGHDMAQDLHSNGAAAVTMVQRGPTCVVSLEPSGTMVYELYSTGPVEDIDLITASVPYSVLQESYQYLTKKTCGLDQKLIDDLERVGFRTDYGDDGTGFHMKYLRTGGGYYINVGCADLIINGSISVVQAEDMDTFVPEGLRMKDGTVLAADLVGLATGYENTQEAIRRFLGDAVADAVGPVWGWDEQGFMRNMWKRTAQPGFWVMGGGLNECRLYSTFLGLQIKAELEGLVPPS
jgi:cation diffusion facilitator CzcD-associated flavoprotein CzcO